MGFIHSFNSRDCRPLMSQGSVLDASQNLVCVLHSGESCSCHGNELSDKEDGREKTEGPWATSEQT